jgi:hypothetical protein
MARSQRDTIEVSCRQGRLSVSTTHISLQPAAGSPGPAHFSVSRSQLADVRVQPRALFWRTVTFALRDGRQYRADMVSAGAARRIAVALAGIGDPALRTLASAIPAWPNPATRTPSGLGSRLWRRYRAASRRKQAGIGCAVVLALCVVGVGISGALAGLGGLAARQTTHPSGAAALVSGTPSAPSTRTPIAQSTCIPGAENCNPWGYNFTHGTNITDPPRQFCQFFNCVNNFVSGKGYVVECRDGVYSKTGGTRNSCSKHKGELRTLLAP